ncbi:MAG: GTP-binding protein [Candidatus Lokiarchaeota archaeon]|nr:GTP-binding protein [Candidatus Lokiarchaeota archaeon]
MKKYGFKVLLLGAPAVGKTSILYRYVKNKFSHDYMTTIGINYLTKDINLEEKKLAKLVIWDVAGHEKFKFLRNQYYEGTHGALVIFDLTILKTYEELEQWLSEMFEILQKKIPFIIIGNKLDLVKEVSRSIDNDIVRDYAENQDSIYIETSAKTGENIEEAFKELTHRMIKRDSKK